MFHLLRQFQESCRSYRKLLFVFTLLLVFIGFFFTHSHSLPRKIFIGPTVAITQIVNHASLDKVRQGIIDELAKNGYEDNKSLHLIFKNAQGNVSIASQIAQQFVAEQPAVIVAIATPSAQAVVKAAQGTPLPIVFSSITDPVQAGLVSDLKHPGKNVTGTRNVTPVEKEIQLIRQVLPQAKTLGIILNERSLIQYIC